MPGAQATIRWLIAEKEGAPNFAMRVIELARPGDRIPLHGHPYEHEIFIIGGEGGLLSREAQQPVKPGDFVFVKPGEEHGFVNTGERPFQFICVIPIQKQR